MAFTHRDITSDDAAAVADLMARIEADHPTGFSFSAEEVVELLRGMPSVAAEGAWDGRELVAYTCVVPQDPNADGQRLLLYGDVDPQRLGEGLGTTMLGRALGRARAIHARDAPGQPARYATQALAGREDQAALMRAAGMAPGRHSFLMVADLTQALPESRLPDDVVVHAFDPAQAEELREAHNEAFGDYPGGTETGPEFWSSVMVQAPHARHELSFVARQAGGRVAGYVFVQEPAVAPSGRAPGREVYVAYVGTVPSQRGRGLGAGLLAHTVRACRDAGCTSASLNVDTANPTGALGIYERAGFSAVYRQDSYHLDERP